MLKSKITKVVVLISVIMMAVSSCNTTTKDSNTISKSIKYNTPKYVFLFIGDGMSMPQINMAEAALNYKKEDSKAGIVKLTMHKFPVTGMSTTYAEDRYITDSAAAATALATGHKTSVGTLSMNEDATKKYETIAEMAHRLGKKVGIVTTVSIDHATPAAYYAHVSSRNKYQEIGEQLLNSGFDYFGGGSVKYSSYKNKTYDQFKKEAAEKGYKFVNTKEEISKLNSTSGKVIATLKSFDDPNKGDGAMPYAIDLPRDNDPEDHIVLADFTRQGIKVLDNDKGFFMMVEGGKIDWAGHSNDVASNIQEVIDFDKAIAEAKKFYDLHPNETLIVVTGDHECGGLTLGYAGTHYESSFGILKYQNISFNKFSQLVNQWKKEGTITFDQAMKEVTKYFGLGNKEIPLNKSDIKRLKDAFNLSMGRVKSDKEAVKVLYGYNTPLTVTATQILNNKAGVAWTSYSHTALPTMVFAIGPGAVLFDGYYDNTDVAKRIMEAANYQK